MAGGIRAWMADAVERWMAARERPTRWRANCGPHKKGGRGPTQSFYYRTGPVACYKLQEKHHHRHTCAMCCALIINIQTHTHFHTHAHAHTLTQNDGDAFLPHAIEFICVYIVIESEMRAVETVTTSVRILSEWDRKKGWLPPVQPMRWNRSEIPVFVPRRMDHSYKCPSWPAFGVSRTSVTTTGGATNSSSISIFDGSNCGQTRRAMECSAVDWRCYDGHHDTAIQKREQTHFK